MDKYIPISVVDTKEFNTIEEMGEYFGYSITTMKKYIKGFRPIKWANNHSIKYVVIHKKVYQPYQGRNRGLNSG